MLRRKRENVLEHYYLTVDECMMSNFKKLHEKNDSKALRKHADKGNHKSDMKAVKMFSQSFFEFQGISYDYSLLLDLKHQLALLQIKYLSGDGRYLINSIRAKERQIKEQEQKTNGGMSVQEAKIYIEENMRIHLELDRITVEDFYTKIKHYGRKH